MEAPPHQKEDERIALIQRFDLADGKRHPIAEDIALLARIISGSPSGITSIIDDQFQWYTGKAGVEKDRVPRRETFCQFTLLEEDLVVVSDARNDERFRDNPSVLSGDVCFYAGARIREPGGLPVGTVCVFDSQARELSEEQKAGLKALARQAELLISLQMLLVESKEIVKNMGDESQRGLNAASDVLLNPMTALTLRLAALRRKHPELDQELADAERMVLRVSDTVKERLRSALIPEE